MGHVLSHSISLGTGPMCSNLWVGVLSVTRDWALCHQLPVSHIQLGVAKMLVWPSLRTKSPDLSVCAGAVEKARRKHAVWRAAAKLLLHPSLQED